MTQKSLIELIQQHHPGAGHKQIRMALNRAQDDYCARTELMKKTFTQLSVAGRRYYDLNSDILKILRVQINDVDIPRLIGSPIIDDDEWDGDEGLTAPATSTNDRYWYIDSGRLGVVEKVKSSVTRDDKTSNYQSISESDKEMRIYAISQANDFMGTLTQQSELPNQFHTALSDKVISDLYLLGQANMESHKIFYAKYMDMVKQGRKYARSNYIQSGYIKQVHF
tara:strand:+ start:2913 stop:3584 length:672 start_codon:yes stop_codon:yes gene_type:complete